MFSRRVMMMGGFTAFGLALATAGFAQPMGPAGSGAGRGPSGGPRGPGMMHGAGGMFGDPASYLDGLKTRLAITPAQEGAWNTYTSVVKTHATEMQATHATMYEAMGTATWEERRTMMNNMFDTRQQMHDSVRAAAEALLPALTPAQKSQAASILPGLIGRGGRMMGHGRR